MILQILPGLVSVHDLFNVLQYITFRTAMSTLTAMVIVFLLGPWLIRKLKTLQFGEIIRKEGPETHIKKGGTPTMGGLLIVGSTLISIFIWADILGLFTQLVILGMVGFSLIGLIDDILKLTFEHNRGMSVRTKLLFQSLLAGLIWWTLLTAATPHLTTLYLPFFKNWMVPLGFLSLPFFIFVLVGTSNSVNLTDGLDGLATGCTLIVAGTYTILAYVASHVVVSGYLQVPFVPGSGELSIACGAMVGASLGFLWFNSHPAQIFMGDVGSLALGGTIGLVALIIKQELVLVIAGGIFVAEALSVILQVGSFKLSGRRIFLMAPFHHHFEKRGWEESKVVIRFWILSIICSLLALSTLKLR